MRAKTIADFGNQVLNRETRIAELEKARRNYNELYIKHNLGNVPNEYEIVGAIKLLDALSNTYYTLLQWGQEEGETTTRDYERLMVQFMNDYIGHNGYGVEQSIETLREVIKKAQEVTIPPKEPLIDYENDWTICGGDGVEFENWTENEHHNGNPVYRVPIQIVRDFENMEKI